MSTGSPSSGCGLPSAAPQLAGAAPGEQARRVAAAVEAVYPGMSCAAVPGTLSDGTECTNLSVPAAPPDREPGWLVPAAAALSGRLGHRVQVFYAGERHRGNRASAVFRVVPGSGEGA